MLCALWCASWLITNTTRLPLAQGKCFHPFSKCLSPSPFTHPAMAQLLTDVPPLRERYQRAAQVLKQVVHLPRA